MNIPDPGRKRAVAPKDNCPQTHMPLPRQKTPIILQTVPNAIKNVSIIKIRYGSVTGFFSLICVIAIIAEIIIIKQDPAIQIILIQSHPQFEIPVQNSPASYITALSAHSGAVSHRRIRLPSVQTFQPASMAFCTSFSSRPPSGPVSSAADLYSPAFSAM